MSTPGVNNSNQTSPQENGVQEEGAQLFERAMSYVRQAFEKEGVPVPTETSPDTGDAYKRMGFGDVVGEALGEVAPEFVNYLGQVIRGEDQAPQPRVNPKTGKPKRFPRVAKDTDPWLIKNAANLVTGINLLAGPTAVIFAFNGEFLPAATSLAVGIGADRFDGFVARLSGHSSEKGAIFDDLADLGTFGVSTGIVGSLAAGLDVKWSLAAVGAYSFGAMWRLGNFVSEPQRNGYFKGFATTAASAFITSALMAGGGRLPYELPTWTGAATLFGMAALMNLPIIFPKYAGPSRPNRNQLIGFGVVAGTGILTLGFWNTALASLSAYIAVNTVKYGVYKATGKSFPEPEPRQVKLTAEQAYRLIEGAVRFATQGNGKGNGHYGIEVIEVSDLATVTSRPRVEENPVRPAVAEPPPAPHPGKGPRATKRPGTEKETRPGEKVAQKPGSVPKPHPGAERKVRPGYFWEHPNKASVDVPVPHVTRGKSGPTGRSTGRAGSGAHHR